MMGRYETQAGRERGPGPAAGGAGGARGAGGAPGAAADAAGGRAGRASGPPTGAGGSQPREWYRGLPVPPDAVANFSRRDNTNYMETGVLSALQLTSMFPNLALENFYTKTAHSIPRGLASSPHPYLLPLPP